MTVVAGAEPGDYDGEVVLTNAATGQALHVPVWLGVRPAPTTDVLLVDDDGSGFEVGLADYSATYQAALDGLGVSYDYIDVTQEFFPAALDLYDYRAVVIFTGDNDSFDTSGFFPEDQDALAQWLDSGGRLWMTGQNIAETTDSNTDFESASMGRARLYHGYLGLRYVTGSIYSGGGADAHRRRAGDHGRHRARPRRRTATASTTRSRSRPRSRSRTTTRSRPSRR